MSYLDTEIPAAIRQSKEGLQRVSSIVQAMKEFSHPGSKEKSYNDLNRIIETTITVAQNEWKYNAEIVKTLLRISRGFFVLQMKWARVWLLPMMSL